MSYIDEQYINRISGLLRNFKRVSQGLYNFSCPICGDSERVKTKARGYFYYSKGVAKFKCHNCGIQQSFGFFLFEQYPALHKEYNLENFKASKGSSKKIAKIDSYKQRKPVFSLPKEISGSTGPLKYPEIPGLMKASKSPYLSYIMKRGIPADQVKRLYFTMTFKAWTNYQLKSDKFKTPIGYEHPRLILPFFDKDMKMFGYQGRALTTDEEIRYYTIMLDENRTKVFGEESIDEKNTSKYVVEGPIDSLFIDNCIATAGSSYNTIDSKFTIVPDREPRNKAIVSIIEGLIDQGRSISLIPHGYKAKDINDLSLTGLSKSAIMELLENEKCAGPLAKMKFAKWRMT